MTTAELRSKFDYLAHAVASEVALQDQLADLDREIDTGLDKLVPLVERRKQVKAGLKDAAEAKTELVRVKQQLAKVKPSP